MKNLKLLLTILIFLFSIVISRAQVGIGNNDPQATLDITAANATGTTTTVDGVLIPRVTRERAKSMVNPQTSTMIYIYEVLTPDASGTTINVNSEGFYFYNGSVWEKLGSGVSNDWSISGNTNIVDGTNFMGTGAGAAGNVDVQFRRNDLEAGKLHTTRTSFGLGAGDASTAIGTTSFGVDALTANVAATGSTAVGYQALSASNANNNTAIGYQAGDALITSDNTAVGYAALSDASGANCTAVGSTALFKSTGADNTAVGKGASVSNTSGIQNVAIGVDALGSQLTGAANTAVGHSALGGSAVVYNNATALGYQAGQNNTATNATALGFQAGKNNTGGNATIVGFQAGQSITGANNIAIGSIAGTKLAGTNQIAIGTNAFDDNNDSASQYSIAIGADAMGGSTGVAAHNVAIGWQALLSTRASNNVAIGAQTCSQTTTGFDNVAVGYNAMLQGNSQQNVAIGRDALKESPGNANTAVGFEAGKDTPGTQNTFIGYQTNGTGATTNTISIGYQANCIANNQITLGNGSIGTLRCATGTITAISDRRDKANIKKLSEGIDFIKQLKPVSYTWNARDKSKVGIKAAGFIAQDLLELQNNSSIGENLDLVDDENPDRYEARYGNLLPVMVRGIQEQQTQIEELQKENAELMKTNATILKRLEALEKKQKGKD